MPWYAKAAIPRAIRTNANSLVELIVPGRKRLSVIFCSWNEVNEKSDTQLAAPMLPLLAITQTATAITDDTDIWRPGPYIITALLRWSTPWLVTSISR